MKGRGEHGERGTRGGGCCRAETGVSPGGQDCPQRMAEEKGHHSPPKTWYLLEKALGEGLGGHQPEVGALGAGRASVAPLRLGAEEVEGHVGGWWGPLQDLQDSFVLQGGGSRRWEQGSAGIHLALPALSSSPEPLVIAQPDRGDMQQQGTQRDTWHGGSCSPKLNSFAFKARVCLG